MDWIKGSIWNFENVIEYDRRRKMVEEYNSWNFEAMITQMRKTIYNIFRNTNRLHIDVESTLI